jgi:hypothetical protein
MIRITADGADIVGRPASLAVALLAIALAPFPPSAAHAACKEWKLNEFTIKQTNGFFVWGFPRSLGGGRFEGGIRYYPAKEDEPDKPDGLSAVEGKMEGSVSGDDVSFTVHWNNGALAEYTGQISEAGFVDGKTVDKFNPGNTADWSQVPWGGGELEPAAACMDVAAPAAPPPPSHAESPLEKSGVLKNRPGAGDISTQTKPPPPPAGGGPPTPPSPPPPPPFCGNLTRCNVLKPSNVFDAPGGNQIDSLPANTADTCLLEAPQQDNTWFHVKWPARKEGGWVFSGPGYENAISCP